MNKFTDDGMIGGPNIVIIKNYTKGFDVINVFKEDVKEDRKN
jgi:hypothetical protein